MTFDQFKDEITRLTIEFDRRISDQRLNGWYREFQGVDLKDFRGTISMILDTAKYRYFPRMGEFKDALRQVRAYRLDREANQAKITEREAIAEIMAGPKGDSLRDENKRRLKRIYDAIQAGSEAVRKLAQEWGGDAQNPPLNAWKCICSEDGLVYRRDSAGYWYVGACSRCRRGPKNYPLLDPITLKGPI